MQRSDLKIEKPFKGLIQVIFPTQYDITSTFMRIAEFYEGQNDALRGHHFSYDDVLDDYVNKFGKMTYFEDWNGFNIPGHIFDQAYKTFAPDHRAKELILFNAVDEALYPRHITTSEDRYYVIATHPGYDCSNHEIAHALFHLDDDYRQMVLMFINAIDPKNRKPLISWLINEGYALHVIDDEINSYIMDALAGYARWEEFMKDPALVLAAENLTLLFNERLKKAKEQ